MDYYSFTQIIVVCLVSLITHANASLLLYHRFNRASTRNLNDVPPSVLPPLLPKRFYNEFTLYYTPRDDEKMPSPPWSQGHPPELPYVIGRGQSWYAADLEIMVEYYWDYCVPIFEPNSYFPCVMFNYNNTAYFMSDKSTGYGPCCIYRQPWSPPRRDFMQQFTKYYNGTSTGFGPDVLNQTINWWIIPLDERKTKLTNMNKFRIKHPVFGGYGWAEKRLKSGTQPQVCFWYEGNVGWAQQTFQNFVDYGPRLHDLDNFKLPEICETDMACLFVP